MSTHRNISNKHSLPSNAVNFDITRSDGDSSLWPTNNVPIPDEQGHVNFMRPVAIDESAAIKWRTTIGDAVSNQCGMKDPQGRPFVLRDWPSGYRMFDHQKGIQSAPRHDLYLIGSKVCPKFRSIPEFIPHGIWLMGDGSDNCKCKYCSKRPQTEVSRAFRTSSPSPSQNASPSAPRRPRTEKSKSARGLNERTRQVPKTYAAVQKTPASAKSVTSAPSEVMNVERNNDLRFACRAPFPGALPRWFRDGELVWYEFDEPFRASTGEQIQFWPAIIDETMLSSRAQRQEPTSTDEEPTWTNHQHVLHRIRLLAAARTWKTVPSTRLLPYQAHVVPTAVLEQMVSRPAKEWNLDPDHIERFSVLPEPPAQPPTFAEALTPFAAALQIASSLCELWCLNDAWEASMTIIPTATAPPPPTSAPAQHSSLTSAIEIAGMSNASASAGPSRLPPAQPLPSKVITQSRFQGLWWGGEKIWCDDVVRLKLPRSCVAPAGAHHVFAPAGPGPKSLAKVQANQGSVEDYGASSRAVFLKISAISIVEGSGPKKECRVTGMMYELADDDWEDPNLPRNLPFAAPPASPPVAAGKGTYPLPLAPTGFRFREILSPGFEAVLSLSLIAGRYYPGLLNHPLLKEHLQNVVPSSPESMGTVEHLLSLEGLYGGYKNSVDPTNYKPSREKMVLFATKEAIEVLQKHVQEKELEEMSVDGDVMQIDNYLMETDHIST